MGFKGLRLRVWESNGLKPQFIMLSTCVSTRWPENVLWANFQEKDPKSKAKPKKEPHQAA